MTIKYYEDENGTLRGVCSHHGEFIGDAIGCPACFSDEENRDNLSRGEQVKKVKYICEQCGAEFEKESRRGPHPKFCSKKCNQRSKYLVYKEIPGFIEKKREYAKKYNKEHWSDPEYRKKRKDNFNRWLENNRGHFNQLVYKSMKKRRERLKSQKP